MHRGTLFLWLFFVLAPGVALLLLWRTVAQAFSDRRRRPGKLLSASMGLAVWTAASYFMLELTFGAAWTLAHTRPVPDGMFPEGGEIYAFLALYAILGITLVAVLDKVLCKPPLR